MEEAECGAASLGIILGYFGKFLSLEALRKACKISRDGGKAFDILQAARQQGLIAKGFYVDLEEIKKIQFPVIALWGNNHFLVIEGYHKDKFYLNDPKLGHLIVDTHKFNQKYSGLVLSFTQGQDFIQSESEHNLFFSFKTRFQRSLDSLLFIFFINFFLVICNILIPIFIKKFVDIYFDNNSWRLIQSILICMTLLILGNLILTFIQQRQLLKLQTKLKITTSCQFLWHLLSLPVKFFHHRNLYDLLQRAQSNHQISEFLLKNILLNCLNLVSMFIYLGVMAYLSIILTLITILFASLNSLILYFLAQKKREDNLHILQEKGNLLWTIIRALSTMTNLKSINGEEELFIRCSGYKVKIINLIQQLGSYTEILKALALTLFLLMNFVVFATGTWQIMHEKLTLGTLVAFQLLLLNFNAPINNLVKLATQIQDVIAKIFRVEDVLHYSESQSGGSPKKLKGYIELQNVSFGYSQNNAVILENINLSIQPGQWLGIVGSSGSGKSTLVKLIIGSEKPWSGRILFDNCPCEQIPKRILTNSLAVVHPQPFLFQESIIDNITLWDQSIGLERVVQAAKLTYIHDYINTRLGKYHAAVGQLGNNFSTGEQQQIEIARALINHPVVLILDEATACLDPLTESKIWENIHQIQNTGIIISHQDSLLKMCHEIIILEKGRIIERGSHANVAHLTVYKNLVAENSGYG